MVSQPQVVVDRSIPAHYAFSVHSRTPHGGSRHRSGHSHLGGASHSTQNDFPIFTHTGDIEIVIQSNGQERRYLLHRLILAQCSGFFEMSTSEEWSCPSAQLDGDAVMSAPHVGSSPLNVNENESLSNISTVVQSDLSIQPSLSQKRQWRYELDWENKGEDEQPILVQKPVTSTSVFNSAFKSSSLLTKPSIPRSSFFRPMADRGGMQSMLHLPQSGGAPDAKLDPLIRDYDNLFRLFYNHPPALSSVNIATAYAECKSLLALADMYDALAVTGPRVDHHLLGFGSRLFKQIAKYPPSYLKLGYLARSRVIFSEALIHVVGTWPAALPFLRNSAYSPLPDSVLDLIEDKVDDLEDLKARIESKLLRLTLTTSRGERVNPCNAYLDWLAVSLFRQWLIDNTTSPPASILKNSHSNPRDRPDQPQHVRHPRASTSSSLSGGLTVTSSARVYRLIGSSSSQAYLPHEVLKKFLKVHPTSSSDSLYSRDVLKRFERRMDEIKRLAREIIKPLLRNFLELDLKTNDAGSTGSDELGLGGLPHLTCTKVEDEDIPWD